MTETSEADVEQACESLAARQLFIRHAGMQELPNGSVSALYEFKHSLYRDVLYSRLPPASRRQCHLRLAERAESMDAALDLALGAEMAAHFEAARDFTRATRYLLSAAALAALRYVHGDSVRHLRHAMELLAHLPQPDRANLEIEILERLSDVFYAQGDLMQSAEMDYKIVELAAAGPLTTARIRAWTRLARVLAFQDPEHCIDVCRKAIDAAADCGDPLLQARAEMLRACWQIVTNGWSAADAEACRTALAKIRSLSDELPDYYEILYAHVQCVQGDYEGACRTASSGIPKSLESDNLTVFLSAHSSLTYALLYLGRWGDLLHVISSALSTAERSGNAPWIGVFRASLGWFRYQAGDLSAAHDIACDLLRIHTEEPAGQVRTMAMITKGSVLLARGAADRALEYFQLVCDREDRPRFFMDWYWRIFGRLGLCQALLAKGDLTGAHEAAERALSAASSTADTALKALSWDAKARVALAAGQLDRAEEYLTHALDALNAQEVPFASWRVHITGAEVSRARGNDAPASRHTETAAAILRGLAESFAETEPLRQALLGVSAAK
jgi:tetratricopeptide (TPR) repeat protein